MLVSQATQVLLVSLMIGAFLAVFGVLAVDEQLRSSGSAPRATSSSTSSSSARGWS